MEMEILVALCKRRGFLFQSSEIYGGLQGFWDYGPLGVELKRNVREAWWRDMVTSNNELEVSPGAPSTYEMVGLDCAIIMHPQVWKCSGHYDLFHDYMVDCRESKKRYRYDQVNGQWVTYDNVRSHQTIFVATDKDGEEGLRETEQRALKFFGLRAKDSGRLQWNVERFYRSPSGDFGMMCEPMRRLSPLTAVPLREFRACARAGRQDAWHADRAAGVQLDVQDDRRGAGRRGRRRLPPPRNRTGAIRQLQETSATARG